MHLDILALVAFGEVGDGQVGCRLGLRLNRRLTLLDSGDDFGGVLAGYLCRDVAMRSEGHALGTPEGAGLDDEDLLAARVDSDAKTRKIAIPEDGVLPVDGEPVHDPFGESAVLRLCHVAMLLRRKRSVTG